jgi:hypothetical protein
LVRCVTLDKKVLFLFSGELGMERDHHASYGKE